MYKNNPKKTIKEGITNKDPQKIKKELADIKKKNNLINVKKLCFF